MSLALPALAHISLEEAGTHKSRYGDAELKSGPCGKAGGVARGTNIYTYAPGQKITVSLIETITHPSYFRFAFDNDGDDAFIEPASILPIDPNRKCPDGPGDHCGMSDFYNSPAVLPNMDNLNPHITAAAAMRYTWEVTLPDVECNSCTLQVIQVMQDDLAHGPYDPTPGVGVEDIYHQCIDIVLKRSAGDAGTDGSSDAGTVGDGRTTPGDAGAMDTGAGGSAGDGGRGSDTGPGTMPDSSTPRDAGGPTGMDATTPPTIDAGGGSGGRGGTGAGGAGGSSGTGAGGTGGGSGTGAGGTGGPSSGGSGGRAGASGATGEPPSGGDNGCSCTIVGARVPIGATAGWSLLALALASRRRRR
jgi:hypothetical protein